MRTRAAPSSRPARCSSSAAISSSIPLTGGTLETASTGVPLPSERRAARRSRTARVATTPRSAFVTTSVSGTSMIPAFRNCSASPDPGWTITATVSAASATSVSDWPTPTVSITTMSNAAASACAAARVAGARPPSRSPAAIERMKMPRSAGSASIRARSPSSAPPERFDDGSTASTATLRPPARQPRTSALSSVDLPAPGGPVTPTTCAGASPPSAAGDTAAEQRRDLRPGGGRPVLDQVQRRRGGREVALGEARGRGRRRCSAARAPGRPVGLPAQVATCSETWPSRTRRPRSVPLIL